MDGVINTLPSRGGLRVQGARRLVIGASLLAALAAAVAFSGHASASSYAGSGDWTIPALVSETVTGESLNVSGNLTVLGTLQLVNSTLVVDRNVSVFGTLELNGTTLTFSVDGPGTNHLTAYSGASVRIGDVDGDPSTSADQSVLRADAHGFSSSFLPNADLVILNSRVEKAGWSQASPFLYGAGFRLDGAALKVAGSSFVGGFELFVTVNSTAINVSESSFDGVVSAFNITGGANHTFSNLTLVNHTYGLRVQGVNGLTVAGLAAGLGNSVAYQPPLAPPSGTAILVNGSGGIFLSGLNLSGDASRPAPRQLRGFVVSDSSFVVVRQSTGWGGDVFGDVSNADVVLVEGVSVNEFTTALLFSFVTGLIVNDLTIESCDAGVEMHNVAGWTMTGISASTVGAPVILATNLTRAGRISQFSANTSVGMALLNWSEAGSFAADHLYGAELSFGLALEAQDLAPVRINDSAFELVSEIMISIVTSTVSDLVFSNLTFDLVGQWVINVTTGDAHHLYMVDVRGSYVGQGVVGIDAIQADNLTFAAINVTQLIGPLLQVHLDGAGDALFAYSLASLNSTGSLVDIEAAGLTRTVFSGLEVVGGELAPPPVVSAAVWIKATVVQDLSMEGVNINSSNRNGIYVGAARGTGVRIANVVVQGLPEWGLKVEGAAPNWSLDIQNVTGWEIDGAVVLVSGVGGNVLVSRVDAINSTVGVQLVDSAAARLENLTTQGGSAGVMIVGSRAVTVRNVVADTGIGLDAMSSIDLVVDGASLRGSLWALRASSSSNVTIRNFDAFNTNGGISLRDVSNSRLVAPTLEFTRTGVQVSLFSRNVSVEGARLTTPALANSGNPLEVSYSTGVSVADLRFVGTCDQALVVFASTQVQILDFDAASCLSGVAISSSTFVNITNFSVIGASVGLGLAISSSSDIRAMRGNISGAGLSAILITSVTRLEIHDIDSTGSLGDGGVVAFVSEANFSRVRLDGCVGTGLRILSSGPRLWVYNTSASGCGEGLEILSSSNITLDGVNASHNLGTGIYADSGSFNNIFRNLTLDSNLWNGLLVAVNGTHLIDGNVSGNAQGGLAVWPGVRLDWTIEVQGSLSNEQIDLTGDLILAPGARFKALDVVITVEQTARLAGGDANAVVDIGPGATFVAERIFLKPRDSNVPYRISAAAGSHLSLLEATLAGGDRDDALSAVVATQATVEIAWADFGGWGTPLSLTDCTSDLRELTFTKGAQGPLLVGGSATLLNITSTSSLGNGIAFTGLRSVVVTDLFLSFHAGIGVVLDGVELARIDGLTAINNSLGGLTSVGSNITGSRFSIQASGAVGAMFLDGPRVEVDGFSSVSNDGSGVALTRVERALLTGILVSGNGGVGILALDVGNLSLVGGQVGTNGVFGFQGAGQGFVVIDDVVFDHDAQADVRIEGAIRASLANCSLTTSADHAIMAVGSAVAQLTNVVATANLTGLLAADSSSVFVLNSSMPDPTVIGSAAVKVGWHLRVQVQNASSQPAGRAQVNVSDFAGSQQYFEATDASGSTRLLPIVEKVLNATGVASAFGPFSATAWSATDGRAQVSVNVTRYTALGLRLDPQAPTTTVELRGDLRSSGWYWGEVEITLRAVDDRAEGVVLHYRTGAAEWQVERGQTLAASVVWYVGTEGETTISFYAEDGAGNVEPMGATAIRIDPNAPRISIAPLPQTLFVPEIDLAWSGDDGNGSGVDFYSVNVSFNGRFIPGLETARVTTWHVEASDGTYVFRVSAVDRAGRALQTPQVVTVTVALNGALRLFPVDAEGAPVNNVSVWVEGRRAAENATGAIELLDLPAGHVTFVLVAQGFYNLTLNSTVTAHQTTDLGNITLAKIEGPAPSTDLTLGFVALGLLLAVTAAYGVRMRLKWRRRKRAP